MGFSTQSRALTDRASERPPRSSAKANPCVAAPEGVHSPASIACPPGTIAVRSVRLLRNPNSGRTPRGTHCGVEPAPFRGASTPHPPRAPGRSSRRAHSMCHSVTPETFRPESAPPLIHRCTVGYPPDVHGRAIGSRRPDGPASPLPFPLPAVERPSASLHPAWFRPMNLKRFRSPRKGK